MKINKVMNVDFYIDSSYDISKLVTKKYSTSFSLATSLLEEDKRRAVYAVYGFVRLADEIVDSLHGYDKSFLLKKLYEDLNYALENGISTNPIIVAFASTVKKYDINQDHIRAFMNSMEYDLSKTNYSNVKDLNEYIYGSADSVGLMCLKIFCYDKPSLYESLEFSAQRLGSAFQKVNFLRDLKDDLNGLGRSYFPEIIESKLNQENKRQIELSIKKDFDDALVGVKQLPGRSKLAVALAYYYYNGLLKKIVNTPPEKIMDKRMRISNFRKYLIILKTVILYKTKLI